MAGELRTLAEMRASGLAADGVQPAFPSTTANSHAAIWTGVYGNGSGIAGNANPVLPRAEHSFAEWRVGFRSESLLAEPLWVTATRQGVSVVGHQVTQVYPFTPLSAGIDLPKPPVVINSYQTRKVADYRVLRAKDVKPLDAIAWDPPLAASHLPAKHFTWSAGPVRYVGTLFAAHSESGYDTIAIAERANGPRVLVTLASTETRWPRSRTLAVHFSEPLPIENATATAEVGPLAAVFRLWETTRDGDFLLLSMPLQELGIAHGRESQRETAHEMVAALGPLAGNGPSGAYMANALGKPLYRGGDGTAELRFLETMEFLTRQYNRYSQWLWKRYAPRLMVDYFPYPDEMDHGWLGLSRQQGDAAIAARAQRFLEFRRRGYQIIDARMAALWRMAKEGRASDSATVFGNSTES